MLALMEMMVNRISALQVKRITLEVCGQEFSKSPISRLAQDLDEQMEAWNDRPLDGSRYPFVLVDATQIKIRRLGGWCGRRVP